MPSVYVLRDATGRHYLGCTAHLEARLAQHLAGGARTTRRMVPPLDFVAHRDCPSFPAALAAEREFKRWKNTAKVVQHLSEG
jgi:predicted GIY-YIG superfamily endonuclease